MEYKGTVVLVDDELRKRDLAVIYRKIFEDKNLFCLTFDLGREVEEEIKAGLKYDCLVVDLQLIDRDGQDIIKLSKKINPYIPVIVYSGWDWQCPGADRVIRRPSLEYLISSIEEFILRKQ
ncbi:hypothetical protein J4424_06070 [Candidatus Woesearchaeota archaeon]|nr:hypothetical protein [Candidatus Woesearchaeota archaeon]